MTWTIETDPSEETWADSLLRSDDGRRLLWLRARAGVEGGWRIADLEAGEGGAMRVAEERDVPVADAIAMAPEHAHDIMRMSRDALERYAADDAAAGERLAGELDSAAAELEREDVPGAAGGTHTKRGEDVVPPIEYEGPQG